MSSAIRHRIKEITLHPAVSKHSIGLEILIENKSIYKLPSVDPGQTLRWDLQTFPCDVRMDSRIEIKLTKSYQLSSDSELLVGYEISETTNQTSITKSNIAFPTRSSTSWFTSKKSTSTSKGKQLTMTVRFPDTKEMAHDYSIALVKAKTMIENENSPLERIGNARVVLKTVLDFGGVVAELHPIAKLVVGLCTKAWEHLEKLEGQHDSLQDLINGLAQLSPFIESVKNRAKEILQDTIMAILYLMEDTSNFIINYVSQMGVARALRGLGDSTESERIAELLKRFGQLKENFSLGIGVQTLIHSITREQRALLDRLRPAARSHYSSTPPCQDGTRTSVLNEIYAWSKDPDTSSRLIWLHGQAGMGKSTIASSVCRNFDDLGTLGAHFFCKRDDQERRTPEHILNSLVYRLASQYEPYGQAVADAIESNVQLPEMPLEQRYMHLVSHPLQELRAKDALVSHPFLVVVDALDECEPGVNRRLLLTYLREMSRLVPWIKVLITSRPEQDIKKAYGVTDDSIDSRSLLDYDASADILQFTRTRMAGIAEENDLPAWPERSIELLSTRAGGLFIWIETACKFIEEGASMSARLEQILEGTSATDSSEPLDLLYSTAIRKGAGEKADNVRDFRACIGAIVATASRTPLPLSGLQSLLSGHISSETLRTVVNRLGSVLYEDRLLGGAVRVYHPSFADFILDPARSKDFHTDPKQQNGVIVDCCLKTMIKELKFNICGLETSYLPNSKVPDFPMRVQNAISRQLAYSCMHWSDHLTKTSPENLNKQLGEFLYGPHLLYWVEAASLLGQLRAAVSGLLGLVDWASDSQGDLASYANDAYRLILTFYDTISHSTPHLYISALAFAPTGSKVAERMRPLFPNTFVVTSGTNESWPRWLQSISHYGMVWSVACSGDGRRIVSGSGDGTVRVWDSETGAAVSEPLASPGVNYVAISSDRRRIASGSSLGILRVWDSDIGTAVFGPFDSQNDGLVSLVFAPESHNIYCGYEDGTVRLWDIEAGVIMSELQLVHSGYVLSTAFSPHGHLIVSCSRDKTIRVWNAETGAPVTEPLVGHSDWVNCVTFSPNGRLIASGSSDRTVRLWDVKTGTALHQPLTGHSDSIRSVAFSSNGRYLASGSWDMTVRVWDVEKGMPACEPLLGHAGRVLSVSFCSNDQHVIFGSYDKVVQIWDVGVGVTMPRQALGHSGPVNSVAFSTNNPYLASGSKDGTIRIWDMHTGDEALNPMTSNSGAILSICFSLNDQHIVSLSGANMLQVWQVETGALVNSFPLSHSKNVRCIALSPDGRHIASGSEDNTVGLWDAETGVSVFPLFTGHSGEVNCVAFSPDSCFISSGSDDCTLMIWETKTGTVLGQPLTGHSGWVRSVCFSPDSRCIASSSSDGTIQVWDIKAGAALLEPFNSNSSWVRTVAFSPDGRYIISGTDYGTVLIWDTNTGATVASPLVGHLDNILSIVISPDGRFIATGSKDNTVRIWDMKTKTTDTEVTIATLSQTPSELTLSTGLLAHSVSKSGWVTSSDGDLLLWLPKDRRRPDDSVIQISADLSHPTPLLLDFSKFVHGKDWVSVANS